MIGPASFPTPHLALRSADEAELTRARAFASVQAVAAEAMRVRLTTGWRDRDTRVAQLRAAHRDLVDWRCDLASRAPGRLGIGIPQEADRFRMTIDEHGANYDRIGYIGRLRANPVWDESTRTFRGGRSTPAHETMLEYGREATARFAADDDVLRNPVILPGGEVLPGNSLVRGQAAMRIANELIARIVRRQGHADNVETGGDPIYVVSASRAARARMFAEAVDLLAAGEPEDLETWQAARYLLYQAPITKKGSDAVTRTFLVAVGAVTLGRAPVLAQDVDLRCVVLGQDRATRMPTDVK
ncbi:hypothetical protein [Umezawaea sp. Da 62-37]|uniref:hypothetical protein n=1 Tax=Umezawaea sp. Da 62-37 TaxID=3075927 RepID=UPI0028F73DC4|nr:hypothetical protein [Umezawaea sp. Da 62-37]WNV85340.1 hypothetical protein RM788_45695 [Umezawaea sp. Da 62-37]